MAKRKEIKFEYFIAVLPAESINMSYHDGEIQWMIKDNNNSIIFTYDIYTKFAYWNNPKTQEHGRYFRRLFKPYNLEQAITDWESKRENWTI